jgi:hypothetical protein
MIMMMISYIIQNHRQYITYAVEKASLSEVKSKESELLPRLMMHRSRFEQQAGVCLLASRLR